MKNEPLKTLYIDELRDLYSAETQLVQALPQMISAAIHEELRAGLQMHLEETYNHVNRLETIFADLGIPASGETCEAMQGLIQEAKGMMNKFVNSDVQDAAIIACAQRIEHYEIAAYGTARAFANHLDLDRHADLLQKTLDEEGAADKKLTKIAEGGWFSSGLNEEATRN